MSTRKVLHWAALPSLRIGMYALPSYKYKLEQTINVYVLYEFIDK